MTNNNKTAIHTLRRMMKQPELQNSKEMYDQMAKAILELDERIPFEALENELLARSPALRCKQLAELRSESPKPEGKYIHVDDWQGGYISYEPSRPTSEDIRDAKIDQIYNAIMNVAQTQDKAVHLACESQFDREHVLVDRLNDENARMREAIDATLKMLDVYISDPYVSMLVNGDNLGYQLDDYIDELRKLLNGAKEGGGK